MALPMSSTSHGVDFSDFWIAFLCSWTVYKYKTSINTNYNNIKSNNSLPCEVSCQQFYKCLLYNVALWGKKWEFFTAVLQVATGRHLIQGWGVPLYPGMSHNHGMFPWSSIPRIRSSSFIPQLNILSTHINPPTAFGSESCPDPDLTIGT